MAAPGSIDSQKALLKSAPPNCTPSGGSTIPLVGKENLICRTPGGRRYRR